jgi:hypothetical protein
LLLKIREIFLGRHFDDIDDIRSNTGYTQKNCAVSKVNKTFISQLTRAQHTSSAAATVQFSHALIKTLNA